MHFHEMQMQICMHRALNGVNYEIIPSYYQHSSEILSTYLDRRFFPFLSGKGY